jgi:hypothetical protein
MNGGSSGSGNPGSDAADTSDSSADDIRTPPGDDSGGVVDSPVDESSSLDTFVPPEDVAVRDVATRDTAPPKEAATSDACGVFNIKAAMEYDALDGGGTPCTKTSGCTATECCYTLGSPPLCVAK